MKPDIQIAQEHQPIPIKQIIVDKLGLSEDDIIPFGQYIAKLNLATLNRLVSGKGRTNKADGKLIIVTAITPTRAGEGKTVTTIGLTQSLDFLGKKAIATLRQPSMGPVFGVKGGATGGGYSQVYPMWQIDLEFTGDFHAVTEAHNLLSALIDNHIAKDNRLNIDPTKVTWLRALDMNDRALRKVVVGMGGRTKGGAPREDGFIITAASEIMAVLALSRTIAELKERLGNITIGYTYNDKSVYVRDLKATGAMALILRDAIKPNLVQTLSGAPASIHCGPFGNVAHGTASITSILAALRMCEYVVNESGFGADLGLEKFINITSRRYNLLPRAVVVVCSCRALRSHGGIPFEKCKVPNFEALKQGIVNLDAHLAIVKNFGLKPVVAVNKFAMDSDEELEWVLKHCEELDVPAAISDVYEKGAEGGVELAKKVIEIAESEAEPKLHFTYDLADSIKDKISKTAMEIYGAARVDYSTEALRNIQQISAHNGTKGYPICMAKTQSSLSDDSSKLGAPKGFTLTVDEVRVYTGAEFIVPICGGILLMPGLPDVPSAEGMDIDDDGNITGLF